MKQDFAAGSPVTNEAQKVLLDDWVHSNRVTVSLLGVNIGTSDAAPLGSVTLFIMSFWLYWSSRRENHLIGGMLLDASASQDPAFHQAVFHGIASYTVFTAFARTDQPIDSIKHHPQPADRRAFVRPAFVALLFLPVFTIVFIIFTDIWSIFDAAPWRFPHTPLYKNLNTFRELGGVVTMEAIALVICTATCFVCYHVYRFQRANSVILRAFYDEYVHGQQAVDAGGA
jgi:hypothetical protein